MRGEERRVGKRRGGRDERQEEKDNFVTARC